MPIKGPNTYMKSRIAVLIILLSVCGFAAVAIRLFFMQVINYDYYESKALSFQTRDNVIAPSRGTIYDRNMRELAVSASTESVIINPAKVVNDANLKKGISAEQQQENLARMLAENLDLSYDAVLAKVKRTDTQWQRIKRGVEKDVMDKINTQADENNYTGIEPAPDTRRYYPYGSFASQILGFLGDGGEGVTGLEIKYNETLAGTSGRVVRAQNADNKDMPFEYEHFIPAEDGASLVLTIDEAIQHFLEKHLETGLADNPRARGGLSGIVMNVHTGEILAMANMPDYDANNPYHIDPESMYYTELETTINALLTERGSTGRVTQDYISDGLPIGLVGIDDEELRKAIASARGDELNKMWRNHIVSDAYEPGSTFKLMNVATALETQSISTGDSFFCGGGLNIAGWDRPIKCWKTGGHGSQDLIHTLMNSCNVAMMNIAFKTTPSVFYEYFSAFGLLDKTGIDLPGEAVNKGLMYTEEQLTKTPSNLAVSSFGQRFKVTPIQMISMVSAIVDDGRLKTPHVVKEVLNADGTVRESIDTKVVRQVVSAETSAFMRQAMEQVVSAGTGQNAYVAGYRVGGKTATSEIEKQEGDVEPRYTASFVGVAPMDDPQVIILVTVNDLPESVPHGGGAIAAPIVGRVFSDILPYLGVEQVFDEEESDRRELAVPGVIGKSAADAQAAIENAGLTCRVVGDGDTVTEQVPASGVKIPADSRMILYMGVDKSTETITVPDLTGLHPSVVQERLKTRDLYFKRTGIKTAKTNGQTRAVRQTPVAGTQVSAGTVITVEFENTTGVTDR